jgi:hypothetical protein
VRCNGQQRRVAAKTSGNLLNVSYGKHCNPRQ